MSKTEAEIAAEDEKLHQIFVDVVESIYDNFSDTSGYNLSILIIFAGVSLSAILRYGGIFKFFKVVMGAFKVRKQYPDIINI